jgi:hypothetical protein
MTDPTPDQLAEQRRQRNEVFVEVISDYERLRGYMALKHGDSSGNSAQWLADNGHGLFVEGVPEADEWRRRFWPGQPVPKSSKSLSETSMPSTHTGDDS